MATTMVNTDSKQAFLKQFNECVQDRLKNSHATQFSAFARLYYANEDLDEIEGKAINDVFGNAFGWWNFIQEYSGKAPKISVFNPSLEEDGWLCGHTVVAVLQKDMPFLVDSISIEINSRNIELHAIKSIVVTSVRDDSGNLLEIVGKGEKIKRQQDRHYSDEAIIYLEINRHTDEAAMRDLSEALESVLRDVEVVVEDYKPLLECIDIARANYSQVQAGVEKDRLREADEFLKWLADGFFTFLGHVEYEFVERDGAKVLMEKTDSRLGLFRLHGSKPDCVAEADFNPGMAEFHRSAQSLSFTKSAVRSRVHRHAYSDYVVVKQYDENGVIIGERRFLGLYTSPVYTLSPTKIPKIRGKVDYVMKHSGLNRNSHDGKALLQVLETFPRDELLQASEEELLQTASGVSRIKERHMVRLFVRNDPYGKFVNCIVYVPRDKFSTEVRHKIQDLIGGAIKAQEHEFTTYFSESVLARTHIVFRVDPDATPEFDVKRLEQQIVDITRSWEDRFHESLCDTHGEEKGVRLFEQYGGGFSSAYRESYEARSAVQDLETIADLSAENSLAMSFYQPMGAEKNAMRFKVFHYEEQLELSDVIPVLENLGLRVVGEHPYRIGANDGRRVWMHDFDLTYNLDTEIDAHRARNNFQEAFAAIWRKQSDSDAFNRLILGARISWREVVVLRAYASYMKQTLFNFSDTYIANTLANHLSITRNLVALFKSTFDPRVNQSTKQDIERIARLQVKILESLDEVDNLNEDRIIRRYLDLIQGTLRTNFFQPGANGEPKNYVSFKFAPQTIPDIPEPRPLFEIFVYSPRVEGVHLRGGTVARGGLRWSDRQQDYRTEVLGLGKSAAGEERGHRTQRR